MADILIIANPASGKYKIIKPLLHKIMDILKEKADKVELALTEYRGHGTYIAQNSLSHVIIAAGGDGLVNEVAKGVVNTDKLFYVLPFGTKNVFCKEYGISVNPVIAAKKMDLSSIKKIPVGYIDNKIFLLMAGVGFDAHVVRKVEKKGVRFKLFKTLAHVIHGFPAFFTDKYSRMYIYVNGKRYGFYHGVFAVSSSYAGTYKLGKIHKGKINCFLVEKSGRISLFKSFAPLFFWFGFRGTHINAENIKLNGASFCQLDGEYTELQNESTYIMIKENAINFIAPSKKL